MHKQEQIYYQQIQDFLLSRRVTEVFYEELDYQDGQGHWEESNECHSLDLNIILQLDNQELVQIKWDNEFYAYGLGLEKVSQLNPREGIKIINASSHQNWTSLINQRIVSIHIYWDECNSSDTNFLPTVWEVQFEHHHKIWIATVEIYEGKMTSFWANHLTIFFSREEAIKYQLIPADKHFALKA
ncbi:hypothetical protein BKI52_17000 [marine bacterium AO1-C]|nr:hypothetical protein BKI52_17000 [marine bacterium AO1-C]